MAEEKIQISKIRDLIKDRNKKRVGKDKRELEDPTEGPPAKRRTNKDIREMIRQGTDKNMTTPQEHE